MQGLGQGYHKNKFYYGSTIEKDGRTLDSIITSDRKIYINYAPAYNPKDQGTQYCPNEIKKNFGLNYRFSFFDDVLDFTWSRSSIQKWLFEDYTVDIKELFNKLVDTNRKSMIYEDERAYKFVALDIMKTYWFQLVPANARTFFNAEKGSGKTNQIMIYKAFAFNPTTSADFSSASIYRIIESTGATILFDDFDELPETQKLAVTRHIRVNYKKFKTLRADGGFKQFRPVAYNSYSHLVFNNVYGLGSDYITPDRVITVRLLKHPEAQDLTFDPESSQWIPLRDDLYVCGLQYWKEVVDNYNTIHVDGLTARHLEIIKPILAIAKIIGDGVYNDALDWYKEQIERESIRDISEDWEYLMLRELWFMVKDKDETKEVCVKDLVQIVSAYLRYDKLDESKYNRKFHSLATSLGKKLKSYLIFKGHRKNGITYYDVDRKGLEQIIKSKGLYDDVSAKKPEKKLTLKKKTEDKPVLEF